MINIVKLKDYANDNGAHDGTRTNENFASAKRFTL